MRKTLSLTAIIICSITSITQAQFVNIPDANFRNLLQTAYPSCFNVSGQMDTTCAAILTEDTINLPPLGAGIATLDGVQYFKSLELLNCVYANVADIPSLPSSLKSLILLGNNGLTNLPTLPPVLEVLNCSECQLASLPALPASLITLICSGCPLTSLPALPSSLIMLDCSDCTLTGLPALPSFLTRLDCSNNSGLSSLPALPSSLQFANFSNCSISTIPDPLPAELKELDCSYNNLISVMPALPNGVERLKCRSNLITSIPALPSTLTYIECGYNQLTELPVLPAELKTLYCYVNLLTTLPALPTGLKDLMCGGNLFGSSLSTVQLPDSLLSFYCEGGNNTALPAHLPSSLRSLHCGANQLTQLPALPSSLIYLNCFGNQLTSLPDLPKGLQDLNCELNNIYCLPILPDTISSDPFFMGLDISFDADKIKCIPNRPRRLNLSGNDPNGGLHVTSLPLCNPTNNVNQCHIFPVISGNVFYDNNLNGIKDANENYRPNMPVQLSNGNYAYADHNGYFDIGVDTLGTYTVTALAPVYFNVIPASNTYNFTSYDTIVMANYALQANTSVDSLNINITPINWAARPGFSFAYLISYQNVGTTTLSPSVRFGYDNTKLLYDSTSNTAVAHNNNSLTLALSNFAPGDEGSFIAHFTLNPTTSIGDSLLSFATIMNAPYTNGTKNSVVIQGSFDPNDKQATPQLPPAMVAAGNYIDYTIRFQNTGTDTAFNIVITDTLNEDLKANTLQMIASSHNCKATVKGNIVYFEFLHILLPDSNVNELKSHGFVSFRIQPEPTVAINTIIPNSAAIYFDFNAPVITNTAGTLIKDFTVVPLKLVSFSAVPQIDNTTILYWNTANEINTKHFVIERESDGLRFSPVTNILAKGKANNNYNTTVADANTGVQFYRLKMVDNDGSFTYSPIIKIDRRKNTSGIAVMTNPVKDFMIINTNDRSLNNTQCNIINTQGMLVKSFIIKQGSQAIEIKGLPNGVYYLRTANGSSRILIQ